MNPFPLPLFTVAQHDELVKWVRQLYAQQKLLLEPKDESQANHIKAMIAELERNMNQQVYKLYDLTSEEIVIVDGK